MKRWFKFKLLERPFYDPRAGEVLKFVQGRRNRPGKDPFCGGGKVYPPKDILSLHRLGWQEKGDTLMLLLDVPEEHFTWIKALHGEREFRASPKEKRKYDLLEHTPEEIPDNEALKVLKRDSGLPEDATLDKDLKPVIPEE